MSRFTSGLIGGLAVGLMLGASIHMTDEKHRRRMVRDSRRALKRAGHVFDDFKKSF